MTKVYNKDGLEEDFILFRRKLNVVSQFEPKAEYLYPIIQSAPFQDTETALDMAMLRYGRRAKTLMARQKKIDAQNNDQKHA